MSPRPGDLVALTGGTGDLGRRVLARLLDRGFKVRLLSRERPRDLDGNIEHRSFDLLSPDPLPAATVAGCAAVVHLAAFIPSDQNDWSQASTCLAANGAGTARLLGAMQQAGVERLVHTTAANAYAPGAEPPDETAPLYPADRAAFYLTSKVAQEIFAAHWAARHGMSVTALRLSALYGAGQKRGLFTSFARKLLAGEPVRLANGGSYGADFLTLDDAAAAVLLFLESGASGSFNIASGSRSTLKDAASLLLEMTGANAEQLVLEPSTHSDPGFPAIAIDKAGTQGFSPTGIREGLRQLVDWVRSGTPARAA